RDPDRDRPRAFEAGRRIEGRALTAGVKVAPAAGARRVRADVLQVAQFLAAGAADEDHGLVLVGAAPAGPFGTRWPRARRPAAPLAAVGFHVALVAVLAVVHKS